jgi:putative ABC transport system ATP-binding protein
MSDPAIRTVDLVKQYEGGAITALAGVSIEIGRGEHLCVMGPSGSGKSTFLNLVGALDYPTRGEVFLNGRALSREPDLDSVRAREVGFVFQLHNLIPTLTSLENVEIPMMALGTSRGERRRRAAELLDAMGLGHRRDAVATRLSGGERQRVSIARALANRPAIILADEPTGDVDSRTGEQIMECIHAARRQTGATLVVVTHNPDLARGADRALHMKDGRFQ